MHRSQFFVLTIICVFIFSNSLFSQQHKSGYFGPDPDPCGFDDKRAYELYQILGAGWGYNYDSLLIDLAKWETAPYISIDSIGASVQGRTIWRLTITDTAMASESRTRISIHARTHPNEVQSTWVTNEIIKILTDSSDLARILRENCIFNIVPMYNPDGVELGNGRTNANDVDLERNWDDEIMEPEAAALKKTFESYMASESPVRIALNMHSSGACKRFFVYHHETGTSQAFADDQKYFISSIRNYWSSGIENWDYFVSWVNNTPIHYPESWFWLNYHEGVMALTYEDMNCAEAGQFDKTADAILSGIKDYLGLQNTLVYPIPFSASERETDMVSVSAYPNPVSTGSKLNISIHLKENSTYELSVYNILGQKVATIHRGSGIQGTLNFSAHLKNLSTGMYYLLFKSDLGFKTVPLLIIP